MEEQEIIEKPTNSLNEKVGLGVRVCVLIWSGGILSMSYLGLGKPSADLTFPASIFSASLASFGIERSQNGTGGTTRKNKGKIETKNDLKA